MDFKVKEMNPFVVIEMPDKITRDNVDALEVEIKSWLLSPQNIHVLDFAKLTELDPKSYKAFVLYNKSLRTAKKPLYCINVEAKIAKQIKADGINSALVSAENLDEIQRKHSPASRQIDVKIINPFIEAAKNVLETQASTKIKPGAPFVKTGGDPFPIEIAGLIPFNSEEKFKGAVVLCFQKSTFIKVYGNMVGEEIKEFTDDIQDGAGELMNMIYGQAKTAINALGHKLTPAVPTVLVGDKLKIRHQSCALAIILPFESDAGPLFIEVMIEKTN